MTNETWLVFLKSGKLVLEHRCVLMVERVVGLRLASAPAFSSSSELAEAAVADVAAAAELVEPSKPFQIAADLAAETAETAETATPGALESDKSAAPALAATIVAAADDALAAVGADRPAVLAVVDTPAEPAVASPVVAMDIPAMPAINADTDVQTLVVALIRNEQFISALVNNEAFLDRLAGEDRVVEELARRKGLSVEAVRALGNLPVKQENLSVCVWGTWTNEKVFKVEARDELATELRRRQQMMDALAARGEEAVLAVADAAKRAAEEASAAARNETMEADVTGEVGVVSSGKSALVAMSAAVELLEDSQELLAAIEANPGSTPLSAIMDDDQKLQREMSVMEAAVARAENSVSKTLGKSAAEQLPAIQDAVRELYSGGEQQDEVAINRAYTDLVTAVAEMQRAYGTAISKAVGHAVAEVVEVEEAAIKGAEKTKVLLGQKPLGLLVVKFEKEYVSRLNMRLRSGDEDLKVKVILTYFLIRNEKVEELEKAVSFNSPATRRDAIITQEPATVATNTSGTNLTKEQDVEASGLKFAVVGAFLFWFWGTFVQPKSRYSR
ncbi:hypothetical protein VOLCADRAFT_90951 [Volvox carteri f. nagariensis]|uniref:Uncharacterized protein n=1 Tax=Volvox carteri f. nagariensis TaxID=3068 RepID=D8TVT5_VOLCA|nr:uncharacterized protein VOLCADRAFT_90951 [Volvox carteri f. nagariensis]EFJ48251.1 hypothetical protein VOLCADRAFT_90951 [Volvox carteri f. nagariensis]|eukprot:XP_002950505.1 hypothetical protein VOLCADRAFT_90951 [Volvox carteri f. nagariensis]